MPLPSGSLFRPLPLFQQERLRRWLVERTVDEMLPPLEDVTKDTPPPSGSPGREAVLNFDYDIGLGDIRVLSHLILPAPPLPVFVAVLEAWGSGQWLVAPFSRYTEPATPGELKLAESGPLDVRVLCVWNVSSVPHDVLQKSWRAGTMAPSHFQSARALLRHEMFDEELPESLADRVGPIVTMPNDPRHRYLKEQAKLLSPLTLASILAAETSAVAVHNAQHLFKSVRELLAETAANALDTAAEDWATLRDGIRTIMGDFAYLLPSRQAAFLAGGSPAGGLLIQDLEVGDHGAILQLSEQVNAPGHFVATIESDPTNELQDAVLCSSDGTALAALREGRATEPFLLPASGLAVRLRDGALARILPAE